MSHQRPPSGRRATYDGRVDIWREGMVDEILGYLRDSVSVTLVGLRGSGRSEVVRLVGDRLRERGIGVVSVFGVAALRDRPLAALAVAGIDLPAAAAPSAISGAVAALLQRLGPAPSVLVLDDADDLDTVSVGVIAAAYALGGFPVLSVLRPGSVDDDIHRSLIVDLAPAVRVTLGPLQFDELHRAVHDLLPGMVHPSAVATIATLSGGLPRLVHALVDSGRRNGALVCSDGVWRTTKSLWSSRLAHSVEPLVVDLTDAERQALRALALRGWMPVGDAHDAVPEDLLDRLGQLGLVQSVDTPAGRSIGIFPAVLTEYLRRMRVVPGSADHRASAAAGGIISARPEATALTTARAYLLNRSIAEHGRAEVDTLHAAWRARPDAERAVALLAAMSGTAASAAEFQAVLDETRTDGATPLWRARFIGWQAVVLALRHGDQRAALDLLEHARATASEGGARLRATRGLLQLIAGTVPAPAELVPVTDDHPDEAELLDAVRRLACAMAGRTADALDGVSRRRGIAPHATETSPIAIGLARVLHGEFDAGVAWAQRAMAEAENRLHPGELQAHAYVAALGLAFGGRLAELQAMLGPALMLSGPTLLHAGYQIGLLELSATAATWQGHHAYGDALATQAGMLAASKSSPSSFAVLGTALETRDARSLWDAVERRFAQGHIAGGVIIAAAAVDADPGAEAATWAAEAAARAVAVASRTQSPFLRALGAYIAATAAGDADALGRCVADLRALGARLHAVKAAVTRALVLRRAGDIDASILQAGSAWELGERLGTPSPGLFARLSAAVGLTSREREIATRLADGMTPSGIASSLGLGVRTVENYLSSAYRKLGSEGRADLVRAVTTWAVPVAER